MGRTPYQLLQNNQDRIILQDHDDYIKNGVTFDEQNGPEDQYRKLLFYLGYDSRENAFCCPKHAPLEKVKRSSKIMISFMIVNFVIVGSNSTFFWFLKQHDLKEWKKETTWFLL